MSIANTILQVCSLDEGGDSYYRVRWPAQEFSRLAPDWRVVTIDSKAKERFDFALAADLLILFQSSDLEMLPVIQSRKRRGKKTIVEISDNYYYPAPWAPMAQEWNSPLAWHGFETLAQDSDVVLVPNQGLKDLLTIDRKVLPTAKVRILENNFPHSPRLFTDISQRPSDPIQIGWGGSLGHLADFLAAAGILREILIETPNVRLNVLGGKAIPELTNFPPHQVEFFHWGSIQQYFEFWKPIHIGVVPMLDTEYSRCRSDTKAVEMAALGTLPILPNIAPYREFLQKSGLKPYNSMHELHELLGSYLLKPERILTDLRKCYEYVCTERLMQHDRRRHELFTSLCQQQSDRYDWPFQAGIHEVPGTPIDKNSSQEALGVADSFMKLKQPSDALRTLQRARQLNPLVPEVALAELKILRLAKDPEVEAKLKECIEVFKLDLRFKLLQIQWANSEEELLTFWKGLIEELLSSTSGAKSFFRQGAIKLFLAQGQANPQLLLPTGIELIKIYPKCAELRYFLAHSLEKYGQTAEALQHFSWLAEHSTEESLESNFLSSIETGYLAAWITALKAR